MIYTAYAQYTRNNLKSSGVAFDNLDRAMKYMTTGVKIHMSNQTYETHEEYLLIKDQWAYVEVPNIVNQGPENISTSKFQVFDHTLYNVGY